MTNVNVVNLHFSDFHPGISTLLVNFVTVCSIFLIFLMFAMDLSKKLLATHHNFALCNVKLGIISAALVTEPKNRGMAFG